MTRGIFDFFAKNTAYKGANKSWYVTLDRSTCFWFDLIVNPIKVQGNKDPIVEYLKGYKARVEETLEKRFIYFFASRPKVRFNLINPPYYKKDSGALVINLLIGRDRKEKTINVSFFGEPSRISLQPKVDISEKFIILHFAEGGSATFSIHDFLCSNNIQLDLDTQIHYIGITKNPDSRPITREHRGVADTLYSVSNEENDFFLFVNLFKPISSGSNDRFGMNFIVANAMTDEIPVDTEGAIIEGCLIAYFDSPIQKEDSSHERAELENNLKKMWHELTIDSVVFDMELSEPSEYHRFYSEEVTAANRHIFLCKLKEGALCIENMGEDFDAVKFLER